ncbi:DUF5778 family protein [Halostella salina]|uniref:DUF5778 family protein n=1 Tax=Halostella salina TaxID=1547897 RepID=UPI000EF84D98|nr:DUF5778 family protein [Halostella salina]
MAEALDDDLYRRTKQLLEPGEIELNGAVVHTGIESQDDIAMTQATIDVGEIIAGHATDAETYVYSGSDDPEFASNQHQGRTLDGDEFVWECQQLLREGTYDVVFYYEASADQEAILADIREQGFDVTGVRGD